MREVCFAQRGHFTFPVDVLAPHKAKTRHLNTQTEHLIHLIFPPNPSFLHSSLFIGVVNKQWVDENQLLCCFYSLADKGDPNVGSTSVFLKSSSFAWTIIWQSGTIWNLEPYFNLLLPLTCLKKQIFSSKAVAIAQTGHIEICIHYGSNWFALGFLW